MNKQSKIKLYAKALAEMISKKPASAEATAWQSNFVKLLILANLEGKSKEILDLAQDILLAKEGKRKVIFETARKITVRQRELLKKFTKNGDIIKEKINPELLAGIKIIINDSQQFDASMQSKLSKIL